MKKVALYAAAILGSHLLYMASELWYGAEWLFGLMTLGWYGLFLLVWKRIDPGGAGVILVTAFTLLDINSIFVFQNLPAAVCSALVGVLLIPFCKKRLDAALASIGFAAINVLVCVDVESVLTIWMIFITAGLLVLAGFRGGFLWMKRCFAVIFALTVLLLLFIYTTEGAYGIVLMLLASLFLVIMGSYKFSKQPLAR